MDGPSKIADLLIFLQKGFGGGTDLETPIRRAVEIIRKESGYLRADLLMISDGGFTVSSQFKSKLVSDRANLAFRIYSVHVAGSWSSDEISDEAMVL